jgi:hypothetical protein
MARVLEVIPCAGCANEHEPASRTPVPDSEAGDSLRDGGARNDEGCGS